MTATTDFTAKFSEAERILDPYERPSSSLLDDELVSIKLRPVDEEVGASDRYVYKAEYDDLYAYLNETFGEPLVKGVTVRHGFGFASVYRLPSGEHILFVEHETGPELIAYLHTIRDVLNAASGAAIALGTFVTTVNQVAHIIRKSIDDYNREPSKRRYYSARKIKVSRRTLQEERELRHIEVETDADDAVTSQEEIEDKPTRRPRT
ncbi:hypothetical protein AWB79_07250 [Caballeronia hypogeia]|uniref:Uncharacterized protein n=1 Tax=Caballeronia hypogeia TaxID=1777140 RepID=A0A158DM04_9BURK|nr:hypothetical protein [Caballeronia hypogeia]SAK95614.1 hypothetical protein AWB79_07250 [Caballeronia hypogeia]